MSSISFTATGFSAGTGPPHTISAVSFGAAATDRIIVAALMYTDGTGGSTNPISSATIGGVSAAKAISANVAGKIVDIWFALVPTGTTGDIVATSANVLSVVAFSVYQILNADLAPSDTDSATSVASGTGLSSTGITITAATVVVYAYINSDNATAVVWTNALADIENSGGAFRFTTSHIEGIGCGILLNDGTSFLLLDDGLSIILLNSTDCGGTPTITATGGLAGTTQILAAAAWAVTATSTMPIGRNISNLRFR